MKFQMNGKEYTISSVWFNQGKKVKYEFKDEKNIYEMSVSEFESKVTDKNYVGI